MHSVYAKKLMLTGGGPPPTPPKFSELELAIALIIEMELEHVVTQLDSMTIEKPSEVSTDPQVIVVQASERG